MSGELHPETQLAAKLEAYRALVERYHPTLDLVSDEAMADFANHIDDARAYADLIVRLAGQEATVLDVGSGVGLPGVVIAASLPSAIVTLVERRRRRSAFLELVVGALGLGNVTVVADDVRTIKGNSATVVTAQAVAGVSELLRLTTASRAPGAWLVSRRAEGWRLLAGDAGVETGKNAQAWLAQAEIVEEPLKTRGSLVAIRVNGGG